MLKIFCLSILIASTTPLWCQVEPAASGGEFSLDDDHMMTPPPVSTGVYPVQVGAESRANFVSGGLVVTGSYNDNILPTELPRKVSDFTYSIVPTIEMDFRVPQQAMSLTYSSGFNLYQKSTSLNSITQGGSASYRFRFSPYTSVSVSDSFAQNYDLYNQSNPFAGGGVAASGPSPNAVYVFPFENQIQNTLSGSLQYQYGRNAMLGGGGSYTMQHFANTSKTPGLDNTNIGEWSAFWSRRLTRGQYLGVVYEYSKITSHPIQTDTNTETVNIFYTKFLTNTISLSVIGGPQHYTSTDPVSRASASAWTPAIQGSAGFQMAHTSFSAAYSRIVTGAGGLAGAYHANIANLQARRQLTHTMTISASGDYAMFRSITPVISSSASGGHTIGGTAFLQRAFRDHLNMGIGYSRFHQGYGNFASSAQVFPDSNREYVSISYQFDRPIGR